MTGRYFQRHGDDLSEQSATNKLGRLLTAWRETMGDRSGVMSAADGSELRADELSTRPLPKALRSAATQQDPLLYASPAHRADYAIGSYHNLMVGLDAMIFNDARDEMRLHLASEFVMIRALLEAASTAVWILAPDSRTLRIERTLRLLWEEVTYAERLANAYARHAGSAGGDEHEAQATFTAGQKADLTRMAERAHVPMSAVRSGAAPSLIAREAGDAVQRLGGAVTFWYWSTASSIAHGEPTNTNMLADMKLVGVNLRDEPVAHVEPSAVALWKHYDVAHTLIETAHALWNRRARSTDDGLRIGS